MNTNISLIHYFRLSKWGPGDDKVACDYPEPKNRNNYDQLWQFKRESDFPEDVYYIESMQFPGNRLVHDYNGHVRTHGTSKQPNQKFRVTNIIDNKVKITNVESGLSLGLFDESNVGFGSKWGAQVWTLKPDDC